MSNRSTMMICCVEQYSISWAKSRVALRTGATMYASTPMAPNDGRMGARRATWQA
jgi:hypothetical protein